MKLHPITSGREAFRVFWKIQFYTFLVAAAILAPFIFLSGHPVHAVIKLATITWFIGWVIFAGRFIGPHLAD